ncbi:MAG: secretin and TonB N-terminal domain-containing protein [Planctomycetota bacterium]
MRTRMGKHFQECSLTFLVLLLFLTRLTVGVEPNSTPAEKGVSKTAQQRLKMRVTYSCVDSPIETVLMALAEQGNIDIVKSPKVTGNVTVKVTNVSLEEALTNILAAHDYTYVATESMIRVIPLPEVSVLREQLVTRIYQVTYADANELAVALRGFVSERGKVALNKGTSHIMVTDIENKIKGIDRFIERIDFMTQQVLVEVRIYDTSSKEGFELSPDWFVGQSVPITPHIIFPKEVTTTEIGRSTVGFEEDRTDTRTESLIDNFVEVRQENSITADSGRTETETRVIELPPIANRRRRHFIGDPVGGSFDRRTGGTLSLNLLNDSVEIDLLLSVLHQQVEAKLLANPRILVLDNETANFEIVREIPYRELLQVARQDPITYTEFKSVGINLRVTPHIARDGMIRLHIEPELGVVVGLNAEGAPIVDSRRANTVAMIKNGQTIAMSGLRKRQTTKDISKVPLLADLPLVGGLFKSETESVEINELVVFITTTIITVPKLSDLEKKQFSQTEFAGPEMTKLRLESEHEAKADGDEFNITEALDLLLEELEPSGK